MCVEHKICTLDEGCTTHILCASNRGIRWTESAHHDRESEERGKLLHDHLIPVGQQRGRAGQAAVFDDVRLVEHILVPDNGEDIARNGFEPNTPYGTTVL